MPSIDKIVRTARDLLSKLEHKPTDHHTAVLMEALRWAIIEHERR